MCENLQKSIKTINPQKLIDHRETPMLRNHEIPYVKSIDINKKYTAQWKASEDKKPISNRAEVSKRAASRM